MMLMRHSGRLTRACVDSLLGSHGTFLSTPRLLGVEKFRSGGTLIIAAGGAQGGGGGAGSVTSQRYRMLLRFDDQDKLRGFEVEPWRAENERVPGQPELPAECGPAESLTVRRSRMSMVTRPMSVAVDAAGRIAAGDEAGHVWLWSAGGHTDPVQLELREHIGTRRQRTLEDPWVQVAFTDSSRALACLAEDGTLAVVPLPASPWASDKPRIVAPRWSRRGVKAMAACAEGATVVAATKDRRVEVCDAVTGVVRAALPCDGKRKPVELALSADGCRLAVVEENSEYARLLVWDLCGAAGGAQPDGVVYPLESGVQVQGLRFSADGRALTIDGLSHVQCLVRGDAGPPGRDLLALSWAFLRPYASRDLLVETRSAILPGARPPAFACDGGAIAIAADRLLVCEAPDSQAPPQ